MSETKVPVPALEPLPSFLVRSDLKWSSGINFKSDEEMIHQSLHCITVESSLKTVKKYSKQY